MQEIILAGCALGILIGLLLVWPQCPNCKKWGAVFNRDVTDAKGQPLARCNLCGHEWNPVEVED